jgi:hypothetical protein
MATAAACLAAAAARLHGQGAAQGAGVRELLELFDREIRDTHVTHVGRVRALRLLNDPAAPPAARDSLLDGLEGFAARSDHPQVAFFAATVMVEAGSRGQSRPLSGVVGRLERIYRATPHSYVRTGIRGLAYLLAERASAARLLASVAEEHVGAHGGNALLSGVDSPQAHAIRELAAMGPAGRDALVDLHRRDAVSDPFARDYLRQLAGRGFPVEDRPPW